jgi:cytosine/uracil/thiamine/allantoin permease
MYREPKILFGAGCFLMILGWVIPALMILQLLESTFFLNFLAYIASFLGLVMGFVGAINYIARHRRK